LDALPKSLWLLGLGHLGQAYCWLLGLLPYPSDQKPFLVLQDVDQVDESNIDTSLLATPRVQDLNKTRACASALEAIGFTTALIERRFDGSGARTVQEPSTAICGFDNHASRRALEDFGFEFIVEAGLGSGVHDYLDILVHTFPADRPAQEIFVDRAMSEVQLGGAYETEATRQVNAGRSAAAARCGMVDVAGKSVGAAFVGVTASCLVVAELLRSVHGGDQWSVLSVNLSDPSYLRTTQASRHHALKDVVYLSDGD
jgi:hypothetical protein